MSDDPLIDGRPISDFKVVELKKELEARDLPKSGNKKDLYERLKEYMLANETAVAASDGGGGEAEGGGGRGKSQSPVKSPGKEQPVNPMVARYLATQEQALKAAQHNADLIRGASSEESEADSSPQRRRSTRVSESSDKAMTTESPIHPRAAEEPQKHANGDAPPPQTEVTAPQPPQSDKENTSEELAEEPTKTAAAASEEEQSEDVKTDAAEEPLPAEEESRVEQHSVAAAEEQKDVAGPELEAHVEVPPAANGRANEPSREEEAVADEARSEARHMEAKETSEEVVQRRSRSTSPESGKESPPPKALPHEEKERIPSPQSDDIAQKVADHQRSLSPASDKDEREEKKDEREEGGVVVGVDEDDDLDEEKEPERTETPEANVDKEEEKEPVGPHQSEAQQVKKPLVSKRLLKTGEEELTLDYDEESPANKAVRTEPQVYTEGVVVVNDPSRKLDYGKAKEEESTDVAEGLNRIRALSPARNPVSQYIHIIGLKRPFTNGQLKTLILSFGEVDFGDEDSFWIDKLKSNCIVKYATDEQAERAREGLHNVKWPQGNEETLKVEFASEERLIRRREENKPKEDEDLSLRVTVENDKVTRDSAGVIGERRESERRRVSTDVREERERAREPAPPTKDLAELFRKTQALPFIYWLPLTEEEAEQRRAQKAAEKPRTEKRDSDRDRHRDDRRRSERSPERKRLRNDSPPRRRR